MDNRDVTLINQSLEELITNGFIVESKPGKYMPTEIGRTVAASGISLDTAKGFLVFLNNYHSSELPGAAVVWQAACTSESAKDEIQLSRQEKCAGRYPELLLEAAGCRVEWAPPLTADNDAELLRSAKRTLIAVDWMEGMPLAAIENGFDTSSGVIRRGMERLSWQLGTMASMSGHLGREAGDTVFLRNLAYSCSVGLPRKSLGLKELLDYGVQRGQIASMVREGIESHDDIDGLDDEFLERFLPPEILRRVRHKINRNEYLILDTGDGPETGPYPEAGSACGMAGEEEEIITIDYDNPPKPVLNLIGEPVKRRTLIEIHGLRVTITDKSFMILLRLAVNLHAAHDEWVHQDELDHMGNTTQMISRVRQEIGPYLKPSILDIIINNGRSGYRLNLPASQVEINIEGIKEHWNMHFRELVADLCAKSC